MIKYIGLIITNKNIYAFYTLKYLSEGLVSLYLPFEIISPTLNLVNHVAPPLHLHHTQQLGSNPYLKP